ncbi:LPXTG cell wall anchor domain-containing protein, partial [Ligilactobacillus equi]|uniref:LPXTG cell wall anchor domain-containing protein n=1 Tax=Ligilactobacillus equi TaxID=137357 RepID=UPI000551C4B5
MKNGTEIDNTAQQVNAGNVYKTNMVKNYVYNLDPKKDVIENLGNPKSLDQQEVGFGHVVTYALKSSILPKNYKFDTDSWSMEDHLDKRDNFNNHWYVYALTDIDLGNGQKVTKNTDISRYFDYNYNDKDSVVTVFATKAFKDILNNYNKDQQVQFQTLIEVNRQGYGVVNNTFIEYHNKAKQNSNTVETVTYKPITPQASKVVTVGRETVDGLTKVVNDSEKTVIQGDTVSYTLNGQRLEENHAMVDSLTYVDDFDKDVTFSGFDVYLRDKSGKFTKADKPATYFTVKTEGSKVTWTATKALQT